MPLTLRPIVAEELDDFARADAAAFGYTLATDERSVQARQLIDPERTIAAFDGEQIVASAASHAFELTLPGGPAAPAAGVSYVGVLPTHRRRGLLTALMGELLAASRRRSEPVAVLWASEAGIYGRFGFGPASEQRSVEVDVRRSAFRPEVALTGRTRLLFDSEEARKLLPAVYEEHRRQRPGAVSRTEAWWDVTLLDPPDAGGSRFDVVHEDGDGQVDGYATYRVSPAWEGMSPTGKAEVRQLVTTNLAARAALWRHLLDLDLITTLAAWNLPPDEPLRWLLADSRQVRPTLVADQLWCRVLDVPAALEARRYGSDGELVIDLHDAFIPELSGRYHLRVVDGQGRCEPVPAASPAAPAADLVLDAEALGSLFLGGVRPTELTAAGRITEGRPGAAAAADQVLTCTPAPWCCTMF